MQGAGLISCKQPSLPTIVLLFHHLTCPSPIYTLCLAITNQLAQDRLSPPVPTRKVREHPSSIPNDPTCPHPDPITRLIAPTPSPLPIPNPPSAQRPGNVRSVARSPPAAALHHPPHIIFASLTPCLVLANAVPRGGIRLPRPSRPTRPRAARPHVEPVIAAAAIIMPTPLAFSCLA
jgi:hypothetical protein